MFVPVIFRVETINSFGSLKSRHARSTPPSRNSYSRCKYDAPFSEIFTDPPSGTLPTENLTFSHLELSPIQNFCLSTRFFICLSTASTPWCRARYFLSILLASVAFSLPRASPTPTNAHTTTIINTIHPTRVARTPLLPRFRPIAPPS